MSGEEAVLAFFVFGGGFWVLAPLAKAMSKRIAGEVPSAKVVEPDESVLIELQQLRQDMNELAERVDFAERLLAQSREAQRLGPGRDG